ncbi:MAG: hypothetical protein JSS61_06195 [Verrucomicrobia bacterium]|nr:hypothetical protein [Verrucomicrobiota bacterium]
MRFFPARYSFWIAGIALTSLGLGADEGSSPKQVEQLNSTIQVGGNYTRLYLKPSGSSSFDGNLGGAQASYDYRPAWSLYAGVKFDWREGSTKSGSSKRSIFYIDTQERIGYTFGFYQSEWLLSLFTGLGYRYVGQKLTQSHTSSLQFRYDEIYIPVGFKTDYAFRRWFMFGVNFTWMPQIYPTVKIVPLEGARWILKTKLANFAVEVPFTFTLTEDKRYSISVNPFYEYWQDGHSTAKTSSGSALNLPGNTYNSWGVNVNAGFSF